MENVKRATERASRRAVRRSARTAAPVPRARRRRGAVGAGGWVFTEMVSREIRELATSFRFRVTVVLTLTLMVMSAFAGTSRYRAEMREHDRLAGELASAVEGIPFADLLNDLYPTFKPPWKLAVLSDGRQRWTPDLYRTTLSVWIYPELVRHRDAEPRLAREPLDWTFVIGVILSMAAFALGYDAACGEKQRAILEMVLSYPVWRRQAVTAKLLAVWACVSAPFVLGAVMSLAILSVYGGIRLSAAELAKSGLLILIGLWASGLFSAMAVWVSIRAREAARSLAVLVLLWVTAVIAIPGAGILLAQRAKPLPTDQESARHILDIGKEVEKEHGGPGSLRDPEDAAKDGYAIEKGTSFIQNERYRRQEIARRQRVLDELAQAELAHRFASASPMFLIQDLAERLLGTGPLRDRSFVEQAWAFGDSLAAKVLELDGLDPESPRLWEKLERRDSEGLHVRLLPRFVSEPRIAFSDLPRFVFRERSLCDGLRAATPRVVVLGLFSVVVLILLRASSRSFEVGRPG